MSIVQQNQEEDEKGQTDLFLALKCEGLKGA